ncbi:hypothetical protein XENOCAPTIV_023723, partial [Xenoophorus captivus]
MPGVSWDWIGVILEADHPNTSELCQPSLWFRSLWEESTALPSLRPDAFSAGAETTADSSDWETLKDGAVFTFGSGRYGQLGHNSFRDELHPRLVAELLGAKVTKIACGRYHTLVLTDPMKVYSFGCNDHQQLGRENESQSSIPLPVQLPL